MPVLDAIGTVDRIEAGPDHLVVVVLDLWHLGTRWVDRFTADELVPAEPEWPTYRPVGSPLGG